LLDEPFGALDPITRREIQQEFRGLQEKLHKTMVFVTHDIGEAFILATRIALLKDGKMILLGPPAELLNHQIPRRARLPAVSSITRQSGAERESDRVSHPQQS